MEGEKGEGMIGGERGRDGGGMEKGGEMERGGWGGMERGGWGGMKVGGWGGMEGRWSGVE